MKTELPIKIKLDTSIVVEQLQELIKSLQNLIIDLNRIEREGDDNT